MRAMIQNMKDITDSREMLDSKPHSFISVFIYLIISLFLIALGWSYLAEIDHYIKASGTVRPNNKISTIRNLVSGKVESICFEEGQTVKQGDILYTVEHENMNVEKETIGEQVKKARQELNNLEKFKKSILEGKNNFDRLKDSEKDYYNRYLKYETDIKVNSEQANNSKLDMQQLKREAELTKKNAKEKMNEIQTSLKNLHVLKKSVEQDKNLFDKSNVEYFNKYMDYSFNIKKLQKAVEQSKDLYTKAQEIYKVGGISKSKLAEAKDAAENTRMELNKYRNEYVMNISSNLEKVSQTLSDFSINLEKAQENLSAFNAKTQNTEIILQKYKLDTLVQISDSTVTNQEILDKLDKDLKTVAANIEDCTVTSPIEGVVNIITEINKGDLLQSGLEVATIVPVSKSEYKIQLYVSNKDIASIKEGQEIKYHLLALPYREYGELTGRVTKIGIDAKIDQESGISYYTVEADVENKPLISYKGVKSEIKVGMACEAQVITKTKKILYYLLEKINLRD